MYIYMFKYVIYIYIQFYTYDGYNMFTTLHISYDIYIYIYDESAERPLTTRRCAVYHAHSSL